MTLTLLWIRFVAFGLLVASFSSPCWGQEQKSPTATASPTSQHIGLIDQVTALQREVETLKEKIASLQTVEPALPVGSVIMWYGAKDKWPTNFEICDGQPSKDLGHEKPDFQGRFARGNKPDAIGITQLVRGGQDEVPLPDHTHNLPEIAAAWGERLAPLDTRIFQQVEASRSLSAGKGVGFPAVSFHEGENLSANFTPTEVYEVGKDPHNAVILTKGINERPNIQVTPRYQEIFFLIKVRD